MGFGIKKYFLEIIVFAVGAAVMILELTGSRVLAPYLGTAGSVWAALIGVVLFSLSLGYFWGGKIADKGADYKTLSVIIFLSAVFIGAISFFKDAVLTLTGNYVSDIRLGAVLAASILFGPPSLLLGMVLPCATRLKLKDLQKSGETIGSLYAVSTLGSILGTFLTGFFLFSYLGSTRILLYLAVFLIAVSFPAYFQSLIKIRTAAILIFILSSLLAAFLGAAYEARGLIDVDTAYNRVLIYPALDGQTGRPVQNLITGPKAIQSSMFLDGDDDLVLSYSKFFRLAGHFNPNLKRSLMIGGGAYSYPKDYLKRFGGASLDVVEIDKGLTALARRYFNLEDSPRLTIYHEDGRIFLNKNAGKYDVIFVDAFASFFSLPYQLTTEEAIRKMAGALTGNGLVMVNLVSSLEGENGEFLRAEYLTYRKIFPRVYLFPVDSPDDGLAIQNVILVALKSAAIPFFASPNKELSGYLKNLWTKEIKTDRPPLTDDYAPVDYYMNKLIAAIYRQI